MDFYFDKSDSLRYTSGSYRQSFFKMNLDTTKAIDISNLDDDQLSTFLHEYIHFLQDILTVYGLNKIYAKGEKILSSVKQIKNQPKGKIDLPINFDLNQDNVQLQFDVIDKTAGEIEEKRMFIKMLSILDIKEEIVDLVASDVINKIDIYTLITDHGNLRFGAREIEESMAFLIQKTCYKNTLPHHQFPYETATLVARYFDPSFANSDEAVCALCEMSLMSSNPARVFVDFMKDIKNGKNNCKSAMSVYKYFEQLKYRDYQTNKQISVLDGYIRILDLAFDKLHEYFKGEPLFNDIVNWLDKLKTFCIKERTQNHTFMEIMEGDNLLNNPKLAEVISEIGGPLMVNEIGQRFKFENTPDFTGLTAVETIFYHFFQVSDSADLKCDLHTWCCQSNNIASDNCWIEPYKRAKNKKTMCPFSIMWRKWELTDYEPV